MWWRFREGFLERYTFSLPERGEFLQIFLFSLIFILALWRVEREERFLWFDEEGKVELLIASVPHLADEKLRVTVEVIGGDFPELYHKKALLTLYNTTELPSKAFSMHAKVKAEGSRVFIEGSHGDVLGLVELEHSVRDVYLRRIEEKLEDHQTKSLVLTYLMGESRDILPHDVQYAFARTGLVHLLVISGFHLAMVFLVLKLLLPYPYGILLGAFGVSLYVLFLVPHEPPVLRAWLMLLFWVMVKLMEGRPNSIGILLSSASILLLFEPSFVRSYSFWLSFLATLYILLGLRIFPSEGNLLHRHVLLPLGVSFCAFLGVSPLLMSFTNISMGSIIFSHVVGYLLFPFTFYGVLQLATFFSLPEFPLKVNALILLWTVDLFSNLDLEINFKLSERFA
ncbi:MAG: ComEC/Rec2 family competence protein, partial [Aquificaceae bacterium]|nr:ComEC/Rec2 family competence protein [Aquificaceae bacterium]